MVNRHYECKSPHENLWKPISGDCGFILKPSEKPFSFSLLQFLASEDFVDRLDLLKCFKDFQNFQNLEIIFLVNKLEPD